MNEQPEKRQQQQKINQMAVSISISCETKSGCIYIDGDIILYRHIFYTYIVQSSDRAQEDGR